MFADNNGSNFSTTHLETDIQQRVWWLTYNKTTIDRNEQQPNLIWRKPHTMTATPWTEVNTRLGLSHNYSLHSIAKYHHMIRWRFYTMVLDFITQLKLALYIKIMRIWFTKENMGIRSRLKEQGVEETMKSKEVNRWCTRATELTHNMD